VANGSKGTTSTPASRRRIRRTRVQLALAAATLIGCGLTPQALAVGAPAQMPVGIVNGVQQYRLFGSSLPTPVRPMAHPYLADYRLVIGGVGRSYRLFLPTGLVGRAPVVVAMTGWSLTGDPELYMHWRTLAQQMHFIVLEPRGHGASWNAGSCCGAAMRQHVDDRQALATMVDSASAVYPINRHRVYLVGYSNGGMMAYDYACHYPDRVAAIGVVAAAYVSPCRPTRAVPAMHVHGLADMVLPFYGGFSDVLQRMMPSVAHTDAVFRAIDARAGTPARNVYVPGAGHVWPRPGWQGNIDTTRELIAYLWRYQR
jgi:poly(3-hydroxybutyrate) depolymerase